MTDSTDRRRPVSIGTTPCSRPQSPCRLQPLLHELPGVVVALQMIGTSAFAHQLCYPACSRRFLYVCFTPTGTLPDGTTFDSSKDRGKPLTFVVGIGQVIRGWDEGIIAMKLGEIAKLEIAAAFAYGEAGSGGTSLFYAGLLNGCGVLTHVAMALEFKPSSFQYGVFFFSFLSNVFVHWMKKVQNRKKEA